MQHNQSDIIQTSYITLRVQVKNMISPSILGLLLQEFSANYGPNYDGGRVAAPYIPGLLKDSANYDEVLLHLPQEYYGLN